MKRVILMGLMTAGTMMAAMPAAEQADPVPQDALVAAVEAQEPTPEPAIGIYSELPPAGVSEPVLAMDTGMPVIDVSTLPELEPAIDIDLVARCIEAEAGCEDLDGKRLVADCIYNLVDHPDYPDNATDVIMRPGTFSVVSNGAIWRVTPSEESYAAARMEIENRISWEILYFRAGRYHSFGTPWGRWGNHYFSTD